MKRLFVLTTMAAALALAAEGWTATTVDSPITSRAAQSPTGAPPDKSDRTAPADTSQPTVPAKQPRKKSAASNSARTAAAGEPAASSRPAKSRPRNAIDRSAVDPGLATFASFDVNKDGYVSRDEAKVSGVLSRQFGQLDRNNDGRLTSAELS